MYSHDFKGKNQEINYYLGYIQDKKGIKLKLKNTSKRHLKCLLIMASHSDWNL